MTNDDDDDYRLPSRFLTGRLPSPLSEICSRCHSLRISVSRYKMGRERKCINNSAHCKVVASTCAYSESLRVLLLETVLELLCRDLLALELRDRGISHSIKILLACREFLGHLHVIIDP
jgi:hypothetical protein